VSVIAEFVTMVIAVMVMVVAMVIITSFSA
jgi:hypothetical protein